MKELFGSCDDLHKSLFGADAGTHEVASPLLLGGEF